MVYNYEATKEDLPKVITWETKQDFRLHMIGLWLIIQVGQELNVKLVEGKQRTHRLPTVCEFLKNRCADVARA